MRLTDLWEVNDLERRRDKLIAQRVKVIAGEWLGVTIQGTYQDDDMVEFTRPAVIHVLNDRITAIEVRLVELGLTID